ncbi:MAG: DEAD/DEAH box helicase, partial [Lentisphaeraceae bacterium]|nr:DEAD/DEAH box helicase [Lentisphaeraceae bacterium]
LRDYQQQGFEWLVRLCDKGVGACLADDMGLGKTLQSIALLLHKQSVGPSIIIAPTSLGHNWSDEGRKFAPEMNFSDYRGDNRQSLLHGLKAGDVIVCSYALLLQDIDYLGESLWNIMILDEAQMVKNSATQRSRALKIIQARSYVALSGTPVENHVGELWNLFDIINPGLLGKRSHFQKNYALPIEKHDQAALQQLREKVKPFILRRLRKDVLKELPESQELTVYLEMNNDEKDVYNACRYQVAKTLKNPYDRERRKKNKIQILAEITRLRKLAANFELSEAFTGRSTKSAALMEKLIELMENEHRVLIFSQFVSHLDLVASYLDEEEISFSRIDGRMNPLQRKNAVQLFESHQREVMLISLKAGGFGLNLTAADFVIHLDPWWNPAAEDQASGRALRIGQTKNVTILRFIMRDSIEEDILKMHEHKREISDDILKGTKAASRMTTDDLLKLLGK